MATKRAGILMGGGDVRGLNLAIKSVGQGGNQIKRETVCPSAGRRSS